jgi:hypothetical protein
VVRTLLNAEFAQTFLKIGRHSVSG